jgi:CHAT domain-containing protein
MKKIEKRLFLLIIGLIFFLIASKLLHFHVLAINSERPSEKQAQAYNYYHQQKYTDAISVWEQLLINEKSTTVRAEIHSYLGIAYRQIQESGKSIQHFKESIKIYRKDSKKTERLAEVLTEIARTYNEMGQSDRAIPLLEEAISLEGDNLALKTLAYRTLGISRWLNGDFERAIAAIETSRNLATILGQSEASVAALNDLTKVLHSRRKQYLQQAADARTEGSDIESERLTFLSEQDLKAAIHAATRAVEISNGIESLSTVRAMLDLSELGTDNYRERALAILETLTPSRAKAELLMKLASSEPNNAISLLQKAISITEKVGAKRTQSFALAQLGSVYEKAGQKRLALEIAEQGQWIAQQIGANDSLYPLQWLSARVYRQMGKTSEAIANYRGAIATLQKLRSQIATASPEIQIDTRTEVEPIYRELLSLLLSDSRNPQILHDSVEIMKQFQFSELQSFFADACLELRQAVNNAQSLSSDSNAAIIHTILLKDSSYTILELPDGSIHAYPMAIAANRLREEIATWRSQLETSTLVRFGYQELAQKLYDLLIRPMESDLVKAHVQELVFVNDGLLRNVPMAALYDGKQFLIEKYPISISLGLNLSQLPPTEKKGASIFGLSVPVEDKARQKEFPPLPNVPAETLQVQKTVGGDRFLNANFTSNSFASQLQKDLPTVHIATHGEFLGTLESTFLRAYDNSISLRQLEEFLAQRKEPVDLLTLSACETAAGNERAILGLAGVALRSGVKNVMASLWAIEDASTTELIADFYRHLEQGMSKAQALQTAQTTQLDKDSYISQWAAFVAIGN